MIYDYTKQNAVIIILFYFIYSYDPKKVQHPFSLVNT